MVCCPSCRHSFTAAARGPAGGKADPEGPLIKSGPVVAARVPPPVWRDDHGESDLERQCDTSSPDVRFGSSAPPVAA